MFFKCFGNKDKKRSHKVHPAPQIKKNSNQALSFYNSKLQDYERALSSSVKKALMKFEIEFPKAKNKIALKLKDLEEELESLKGKISRARAPENKEETKNNPQNPNFDAYDFAFEIFTLKEIKCDRALNPLYYKAMNASDDVGRWTCWLREKIKQSNECTTMKTLMTKKADDWAAKHNEMALLIRMNCTRKLKDFSEKVQQYMDDLEILIDYRTYIDRWLSECEDNKAESKIDLKPS